MEVSQEPMKTIKRTAVQFKKESKSAKKKLCDFIKCYDIILSCDAVLCMKNTMPQPQQKS